MTQEHLYIVWTTGSVTGTIGAYGEAMTVSSIMDITVTWCNKLSDKQLKVMLKDAQYNSKSNFNQFSIEKAIKEGWNLSGDQESQVLMKDNAKLVFNIKIMTQNGVIFYAYLQREYKIAAIMASTGTTISIKKAHMMTRHWNWDGHWSKDEQSLLNWESKAISSQQAWGQQ